MVQFYSAPVAQHASAIDTGKHAGQQGHEVEIQFGVGERFIGKAYGFMLNEDCSVSGVGILYLEPR